MKDEPVSFSIGLIALFVSLPEIGISDIATSYFYAVLQLCTEQEATKFSTVTIVLSGLISQLILLPLMFSVCKMSDFGGFFIGLTTILIMCLIGVIVFYSSNLGWIFIRYIFKFNIFKCTNIKWCFIKTIR